MKLTRGDYILSTDKRNFTNAGLRESCRGTDHMMILPVIRGEGALCNRCYIWGRTQWPIKPRAARPQTEGEASFSELKRDITRALWPKKSWASWISQETWQILHRQATLHRSHQSSAWEVRQEFRKFQRSLRGDRH